MFSRQLRSSLFRSINMSSTRSSSTIVPVKTATAPAPAASYSQAVKANGFIYVSGQIPITAENKALENASFKDLVEQCIQNVSNILEASNSSLKHIVKNTVFLTDMDAQFGPFNEVYVKYFSEHKPARSCVAVKSLPLGFSVEIETIAVEKEDPKL